MTQLNMDAVKEQLRSLAADYERPLRGKFAVLMPHEVSNTALVTVAEPQAIRFAERSAQLAASRLDLTEYVPGAVAGPARHRWARIVI